MKQFLHCFQFLILQLFNEHEAVKKTTSKNRLKHQFCQFDEPEGRQSFHKKWWAYLELNQGPRPYQGRALTN
jgi:hypothetical protein